MTYNQRFHSQPISSFFTLVVDEAVPETIFPPACLERVERIWQEQQKLSGGTLFNGKLLSFLALSQERLMGEFFEYKYYVAQLVDPSLKSILQIEPIAISGITLANEKVLYGRRSELVVNYPDCFELVPSGGIDTAYINEGIIDYEAQLLSELYEEAGIQTEHVSSVTPLALVQDLHKGGFEICMSIKINPDAVDKIVPISHEYKTLDWIEKSSLAKVKGDEKLWVPLSIYLIEKYLEKE